MLSLTPSPSIVSTILLPRDSVFPPNGMAALFAGLACDRAAGAADSDHLLLLPGEVYHAPGRGGADLPRDRPGHVQLARVLLGHKVGMSWSNR